MAVLPEIPDAELPPILAEELFQYRAPTPESELIGDDKDIIVVETP